MQNLKQQFLEICFIMNIKVMMAQTHIFIHFCAVVLLFFVKTVKTELYQFPLSFTDFLFNVRLGTGSSYARAMCGSRKYPYPHHGGNFT